MFYWVGSKADHIRGKGFARAKVDDQALPATLIFKLISIFLNPLI